MFTFLITLSMCFVIDLESEHQEFILHNLLHKIKLYARFTAKVCASQIFENGNMKIAF